ncbi:MAG: class I SAM-dependent methyltransferase, partial [Thermodesulfobacteriota bacterium]
VPKYKYDLILAAGLFDYLTDKQFVFLLKHYLEFLQDSGEIVFGNFSHNNAARPSMELILDWNINHRTKEKLELLAYKSGANRKDVYIKQEDEGVNLFLHIKK